MSDAAPSPPSTLGQRIDALLGPLETEAHQYREAIGLGRQQIAQLQSKVALAEEALAGIEQRMGQILDTLTQQEPLLARAVGRGGETPSSAPQGPVPSQTPANAPAGNAGPTPAPAAATPPAPEPPHHEVQGSATTQAQAAAGEPVDVAASPADGPQPYDEWDAPAEPPPLPTPEEDAQAVDEIMQMLSVDPDEYATAAKGPLADAAAKAEEAARQLGGAVGGDAASAG